MAFRSARIPRLTLFSGTNCSLCDTAKAELAKRSFQLDTINIQDRGQEKWKKKYVYWIPALHLEGQEIAKGRWDQQIVIQALNKWDQDQAQLEPAGIYERADLETLGGQIDDEAGRDKGESLDRSRCFNCGDPDHKVTDCPFRVNRELIALSRQYYQFYQGTLGLGNWKRIHTVEAWRQQRLNWLEEFEPGKIKGELLKDALASGNEEWLRNIANWGYPPGWIRATDPRECVRDRIWSENNGGITDELDDDEPFEIHGDDIVESISFRDAFQQNKHPGDFNRVGGVSAGSSSSSVSDNSPIPSPSSVKATLPLTVSLVRWAIYPPSYFSSQALIPYTPPAPPAPPEPWYSDVFENTTMYANQFSPSFWHSSQPPPPPPQDEPPPLPPSPPSYVFPQTKVAIPSSNVHHHTPSRPVNYLMLSSSQPHDQEATDEREDMLSECDMELSDSN
ncbi:hypothetical protein B0H34DRAFT_795314 [Crassisporium funariophilum]|nr:hypothetical protein B0H34DRAFT_795314 [Crassisporium funariophilum]